MFHTLLYTQTKKPFYLHRKAFYVPGAGIEPARALGSQDFKSCVSTYSTTPAANNRYGC